MSESSEAMSRARLLLKNAAQVVTVGGGRSHPRIRGGMSQVNMLTDHSLLVDGHGRISFICASGAATEKLLSELHATGNGVDRIVDCSGKVILPGFIDGHTHAVFDGDRSVHN